MNTTYAKLLVIVLIFLGESLAIYAEMWGAHQGAFDNKPWMQIFFKMFLIITISGGLLISGYMLGFKAFQNIWMVSVTSITSILIVEPMLAYVFFRQMPTLGATVGLVLGAIGFLATIFI